MNLKGETAVVCGAGGFIGGHLVKSLLEKGVNVVRAVDVKPLDEWYQVTPGVESLALDLKDKDACYKAAKGVKLVYQLAADMGGMGFIENNRALCMLSVLTNTHMLVAARDSGVERFFYSSSACVYNGDKQKDAHVTPLKEEDAYPALPEDGYGWEKLFSERMCRHFEEDFGLQCRVMYIDDCTKGTQAIMESEIHEPINLGSSELVTINQLVDIAEDIAGVKLERRYNLSAPKGVNGRNSDNTKIQQYLGWEPSIKLRDGLARTYAWIEKEMHALVSA